MWAVISCLFIVAMGLAILIFDKTEAGKRFFSETE
jgi:hypothetical protein